MMRSKPLQRTSVMLALLLLGLAIIPVIGQPSRAQSEQVYLALGDSIPAGLLTSLPSERSYPAILRDLIEAERMSSATPGGVELINLAAPGETVETFLDDGQLEDAIEQIEGLADDALRTVTLSIGGNNMLALWESTSAEREQELERFEILFAEVIDELAGAFEGTEADVVVTTYYDLTGGDADVEGGNAWWLRQFNDVISQTASDAGFQVVDLEEAFQGRVNELTWFPADVHPNNAGHELIARTIWRQLAYDQEPPSVEITRPAAGEARSRVPTIYARVEDAVGIDQVVIQVADESPRRLIYVQDRDAWIGLWDGRDFVGSEAEITVIATDVSGNEASDSVMITLPSR
jgi:lysophospholipase L1-like esterase